MASPLKSNIGQLVGRLDRIAKAMPGAQRAGVSAAGEAMRRGILDSARSRGVKPRESWVSVTDRPQAGSAAVLVELRGARAYWAEKGTKTHVVTPKRKQAILTPAGPRASAVVRGARAKPFWDAAVRANAARAQKAMADTVLAVLRAR